MPRQRRLHPVQALIDTVETTVNIIEPFIHAVFETVDSLVRRADALCKQFDAVARLFVENGQLLQPGIDPIETFLRHGGTPADDDSTIVGDDAKSRCSCHRNFLDCLWKQFGLACAAGLD
jgi:hypothetical protein